MIADVVQLHEHQNCCFPTLLGKRHRYSGLQKPVAG
jgi:hypothetical protein